MEPVLLVLREDHSDPETTLNAVDLLAEVLGNTAEPGASPASDDVGVMFTEMFMKNPGDFALLVFILEEPAFDVQMAVIRLLTGLSIHKS